MFVEVECPSAIPKSISVQWKGRIWIVGVFIESLDTDENGEEELVESPENLSDEGEKYWHAEDQETEFVGDEDRVSHGECNIRLVPRSLGSDFEGEARRECRGFVAHAISEGNEIFGGQERLENEAEVVLGLKSGGVGEKESSRTVGEGAEVLESCKEIRERAQTSYGDNIEHRSVKGKSLVEIPLDPMEKRWHDVEVNDAGGSEGQPNESGLVGSVKVGPLSQDSLGESQVLSRSKKGKLGKRKERKNGKNKTGEMILKPCMALTKKTATVSRKKKKTSKSLSADSEGQRINEVEEKEVARGERGRQRNLMEDAQKEAEETFAIITDLGIQFPEGKESVINRLMEAEIRDKEL